MGWFVRRAGLARFTTFAAATGLALSAATGAQPVPALIGLMLALTGAIGGAALSHTGSSRPARRASGRAGPWLLVPGVLLVGLFAGYLGGTLRVAALETSVLASSTGQSVEAELVITGQVRSHGGWQSATAVVRRLAGEAGGPADDAATSEAVLLELAPDDRTGGGEPLPTTLSQGMIVAVRGTIEAPEGPSDSGYDQARQLRHQGIEVVLQVEGPEAITILGFRGGVAGFFDRLRSSARVHLSRGPDARINEVLQGVVMGDTAGIDEGWLTAFRRSGTAHMLSVSGLHVASLAAIMIGLARLLRAPRWAGFLLAASSALLMIPFVGASPPIIRSAVMIVIVLGGYWVGRGRDQWQVLGVAAAVVLALNPFALFDVGFQLSFAAFVGMLVLIGPVQKVLKRFPAAIRANVAVSLAASAGTAPVALVVFDQTSLVSPLANLLVVPTLPVVTGLGMASVFLGFVWTGLSTALDILASVPMMWTVLVSRLTALAPVLTSADLGRAAFAAALGGAALPAALALTGRAARTPFGVPLPLFKRSIAWLRRHRPRDRRRGFALGAAAVLLALVLGAAAYPVLAHGLQTVEAVAHGRGWPAGVEVRVLDIGQGNAILVRTPDHHALLFDAGPAGCDLAGQLRSLGVRRLDLVVISHPHADHFAGLLEAIGDLEVGTLVDHVQVVSGAEGAGNARAAPGGDEAAAYLALRRELSEDGCRYVLAGTGHSVAVDGVVVRLFAPVRPLIVVDGPDPWAERSGAPTGDELNGASVVAVVSAGGIDVLIPGDAEADVLAGYPLPPVEAIVVSHHGSRGAVSKALLERLGVRAAFISVGEGNSFGHPNPGTLSVLQEEVGTVVRTDTSGWVSCRVQGDRMVITTERTPTR